MSWQELLEQLATQVQVQPLGYTPCRCGGVDAAYSPRGAWGCAAVVDVPSGALLELTTAACPPPVAYRPGLFFLREGPVVLRALAALRQLPQVLLVHGHGRAHPQQAGLASWMGIRLGLPTVGVAGQLLCGTAAPPAAQRGSWSEVVWKGEVVGAWLRTQTGVKPVVVSVGHLVTLEEAMALVLSLSRFRFPEPLRAAHSGARRAARSSFALGEAPL